MLGFRAKLIVIGGSVMGFEQVLKGVKVVDLTTFAAAPSTGRMFADWGAKVIKVESLSGDPVRMFGAGMHMPITEEENPIWQLENANKRGIAINLKAPSGMELFHRLLADADVFITNTRIASLVKLGLDYETLSKKYPKLVWGHISGYGLEGPEAARPGFDVTSFWARSGAMADVVLPEQPPITAPAGVGDNSTGMALMAGVCAALVRQKMTGKGERVTASLIGTACWTYGFMLASTQYGDEYPKPRLAPMHPLLTSFCCADGEWVVLTVTEYERYFKSVCQVLGLDDLIGNDKYNTLKALSDGNNKAELMAFMEAAFRTRPREYWMEAMDKVDVACERVRHFKDLCKDQQAIANGNVVKYRFDNGNEAMLPCTPVQFGQCEAPPCNRAPSVGQHTVEIMKELGYSDAQIMEMSEQGAIGVRT